MSQHTQDEWLADGAMVIVEDANSADICSCHPGDYGQGAISRLKTEMLANAKLIAAAPDLLAVCLRLQESACCWSEYDVPIGIVDQLNAAILKAQPPLTRPL